MLSNDTQADEGTLPVSLVSGKGSTHETEITDLRIEK